MNVLIVGASAGLGRALAERGAQEGHNLLLVASDSRDLAALASDLRLRYGVRVDWLEHHVVAGKPATTVAEAAKAFDVDGIMMPIGFAVDNDTGLLGESMIREIVEVNFLGLACLVSSLWPALESKKKAVIIGFGSVAAIRGRRKNILYAAAKRALGSYFESLCHLAAGTSMRVRLYQMGYIDTQQTFGKRLLLPACDPAQVASYVWGHLDSTGITYYPGFWRVINMILSSMPWFVFRRLDF